MRVLYATSEVTPWSKTGGLADVSAGLPAALAAQGLARLMEHPVALLVERIRRGTVGIVADDIADVQVPCVADLDKLCGGVLLGRRQRVDSDLTSRGGNHGVHL